MHRVQLSSSAATALIALGLLVFAFGVEAEADPGAETLYSLPHITGTPGDSHVVALEINTAHDIGGYSVVFVSEEGMLSADGISYQGTRSEGVPVWTGGIADRTPSIHIAVVVYDLPEYVPAGSGPVAKLILTSNPSIPKGSLLPLTFCDYNPGEPGEMVNEMCDPTGLNLYYPDFSHGSILFGLDTVLSSPALGDVDLNGVPFEQGDLQLMHTQLQEGIQSYDDEYLQTLASDVNFDQLPWTVADLLMLEAVYAGDLVAPESESALPIIHWAMDSIWYDGYTGSPSDTIEIPISFANGLKAGAVAFKLDYSMDEIQYVSYSMDGSRLPATWDLISVTQVESGLMFYAKPDQSANPLACRLAEGQGLLVTLRFVVISPVSTSLDFGFEKLQTKGQANGYAAYEPGLWKFASFQQIDSDISLSYIYGDSDASGRIDIDDVVYLVMYLLAGGPAPVPLEAGDFDRNTVLELNDAIALIDYIFRQ